MTGLLVSIGWNSLVALLLGVVVWSLCRTRILRHRPAICHGLWLLVLLKLVTPPLIPVPVLPAIAAEERSKTSTLPRTVEIFGQEHEGFAPFGRDANASTIRKGEIAKESSESVSTNTEGSLSRADLARNSESSTWQQFLTVMLGMSLLVSLAIGLAAMRQLHQVRRLMQGNSVQTGRAAELLREVLPLFHPHSTPNLLIVEASITPMLWADPGKPAIVLSRQLVDSLSDDQLRSILAHELGHFMRRDHWTNSFAFLVTALFWWNPVAWFARRELAAAAEACCDALALERLSGSRKSYAETLLKVVDFVSLTSPLRPAFGIAFGESRSLTRRFEMLSHSNVKSTISRAGWPLLALGSATLMLVPAHAQESPVPSASSPAVAGANDPKDSPAPTDSKANEADASQKCYVMGTVFDKETRKPIADVQVSFLVDSEQDPVKRSPSGTTDADGRYRIEVSMGSCRLWFPRLKQGYWLEAADNTIALITTPDKPVVTHDIAASPGVVWPIQVAVEGGVPDVTESIVSTMEIEDDATRQSMLGGAGVSFKKSPNQSMSTLSAEGTGGFTQCGESGKLVVGVGGKSLIGITTEFVIEPGFEATQVKSIAQAAGTDKVVMTDMGGKKATIGKAKVTLQDGLPLLTFQLKRQSALPSQTFTGRIIDAAGNPIEAVRVGSVLGSSTGSFDTGNFSETDKDGRFVVNQTIAKSNEKVHLRLMFTKDGYAGFDSHLIDLPKTSSAIIDVGQFTLQAAQLLPIRVVDENDKPLAGASVEPGGNYALRRQAIRTNGEGRGVLRNLPSGMVRVIVQYGRKGKETKLVVSDRAADNIEKTIRLNDSPTPQAENVQSSDPIAVGADAPQWSLASWSDGKDRKLLDYRGKTVVLDFWGTWCGPCVAAIPMMRDLEKKYEKQGVVFLGIHTANGDMDEIKKLKKLKDWTIPTAIDRGTGDADGETALRYGIRGYPSVVVIAPDGKIAFNSGIEPKNEEAYMNKMKKLAESLDIPWPLEEDGNKEQTTEQVNKLLLAVFGIEIDKVLSAFPN